MLGGLLRRPRRWAREIRKALRTRRRRADSARLVREARRRTRDLDGRRLLYWETSPWVSQQDIVTHIALAAKARGAEVRAVICDGTPVACLNRFASERRPLSSWPSRCPSCWADCRAEVSSFDLAPVGLGSYLDAATRGRLERISIETPTSEIRGFRYRDLSVGAAAHASTLRYYQAETAFDEAIYRKYLYSALVTAEAGIRAVDSFRPEALLMTHGIYSTWGPVTEYANRCGIPVVVVIGGYETCFMYVRKLRRGLHLNAGALSAEEWESLRRTPLSPRQEDLLETWFRRRYGRSGKFRVIHHPPIGRREEILPEIGVPDGKPIWCVFTNLYWDGSIDEAPTAFANTSDWIRETLRVCVGRPDVQWVVKIHPSEDLADMAGGASIRGLIERAYPHLPPHVRVLPASSSVNPWDFFSIVDGGVVFMGNTTGLELAALGKPVVNAGETVGARRGFSYDAATPREYLDLLARIPRLPPLSEAQRREARVFAYTYFLRLHVPLPVFRVRTSDENIESFRWERLDLLRPGGHPVYDMICRELFGRGSFLLPDESVEEIIRYWNVDHVNADPPRSGV